MQIRKEQKDKSAFFRIGIVIVCVILLLGTFFYALNRKGVKNEEEIPVLTWYVPGNQQADIDAVMEEANKIIEAEIGVKLNLQFIDSAMYMGKINMMMESSEPLDLIFTGIDYPYPNAVIEGRLLDITDLINEHAPGLKDVVADYAFDEITIDGRIYGVPNMQIMANSRSINVQKKYAEEYGLDYDSITTPDDLEPFLEWVHKKYPNVYPYNTSQGVGAWDCIKYIEVDNTLGYMVDDLLDGDDEIEVVWLRETQEDQKAIDTLRRWYKKGYIRPDVLNITNDSYDYEAGKYAVTTGIWKPGIEMEMLRSTGEEYVCIKYVENYYKNRGLPYKVIRSGAANTMIAIDKNCKYPEKAIKLIELLNTDKELYNLIAFGIENKHYSTNEEGKIKVNSDSGYYQACIWRFGSTYNAKILEGQNIDVWEETQRVNEEACKNPLSAFNFDITPVINEKSAVDIINNQYKVLSSGAEDKEVYWQEYVNKMKKAGIDKLIAEYQNQANAFLAENNR